MNKPSLWISIGSLLVSFCAFFCVYFSADEVVYVDVNKLFKEYDRSAFLQKNLEETVERLKSNVDSLQVDWQNELKNYEKERNSMSEKELDLKKQLLGTKQQQLNNYRQIIERQIQEEEQKTTQAVIKDINAFVTEYGENKNYIIIHGATGSGNIMYAKKSVDITDEVLKALNKRFNRG